MWAFQTKVEQSVSSLSVSQGSSLHMTAVSVILNAQSSMMIETPASDHALRERSMK